MTDRDTHTRFVALGQDVYLSRGIDDVNPETGPTVILILGWMGAKISHLHKYTEVYSKRYPKATQILVTCPASTFWTSNATLATHLAPVVDVLEALSCLPPRKDKDGTITPRILVHTFSNGGSYRLVLLSQILSPRKLLTGAGTSRIINAIIFDSCPGRGGLKAAYRAFTASAPNLFTRLLMSLLITLLYCYDHILSILFGKKILTQVISATLLDPHLLPWTDERTPRLYVFSKSDEMVPWQGVEAHAEKARALGMNVRMEVYEASPHVAHARTDPSRYWGCVDEVWEDACRTGIRFQDGIPN